MVRQRSYVVVGWCCASLLFAGAASADVVTLRDGTRLEGQVKLQELGKYVVIVLTDGTQKTVMWDDVKGVDVTAPQAPATAPSGAGPAAEPAVTPPSGAPEQAAAAPSGGVFLGPRPERTEVTAVADRSGVSASMEHECGEGDAACHERAELTAKGGEVSAKYRATEDCSTAPGQVCTKQTSADASSDGLRLSVTKETVDRVRGPKTGATQLGLTANLLIGGNDMFNMTGITGGLSMRFLTGGQFPNDKGGKWFGFFLEPSAQLSYIKMSSDVGGETMDSSSAAGLLGASAGLQWMKFGQLDAKSLKQKGHGFALGGQLGTYVPFSEGEATMTYGGSISYLMPSYNPGTGSVRSEQLNLFVLPTTDLFMILIGGQLGIG